jgi:dihydrofolate reductase
MISLIAAVAENGTIGRTNPGGKPSLPWHLPDDFAYFKQKTLNHPIIMGRKSFEDLGKPLPSRTNIVITRQKNWQPTGPGKEAVIVVSTIEAALAEAKKVIETAQTETKREIFVIGGAEIYALALPTANRLYLTEIHRAYDGDVHFPEFDKAVWHEVSRKPHPADDRHEAAFDFVVYEK